MKETGRGGGLLHPRHAVKGGVINQLCARGNGIGITVNGIFSRLSRILVPITEVCTTMIRTRTRTRTMGGETSRYLHLRHGISSAGEVPNHQHPSRLIQLCKDFGYNSRSLGTGTSTSTADRLPLTPPLLPIHGPARGVPNYKAPGFTIYSPIFYSSVTYCRFHHCVPPVPIHRLFTSHHEHDHRYCALSTSVNALCMDDLPPQPTKPTKKTELFVCIYIYIFNTRNTAGMLCYSGELS